MSLVPGTKVIVQQNGIGTVQGTETWNPLTHVEFGTTTLDPNALPTNIKDDDLDGQLPYSAT